jgi:hypothetical protein
MTPLEIAFFGIVLFLSLVALMHWKKRRDQVTDRLNRGLQSYVSAPVECASCDTVSA